MVKDTNPGFPWDQIKAESMRNICRDLGLKSNTTRDNMIDFLESVPKVGLPKALDNASPMGPSSAFTRTSQKRARDTTGSVTTPSHLNGTANSNSGDEHNPLKRQRQDIVSDYNTRFKSERRGRLSDPGPRLRRRLAGPAAGSSISALVGSRLSRKRGRSTAAPAGRRAGTRARVATSSGASGRVRLGEPVASDATADEGDWEEDNERDEENGEEENLLSSSSSIVVRRRTRAPVTPSSSSLKTRKQKQKEEESVSAAATRRRKPLSLSRGTRVVRVNGATTADDEVVKTPRRSARPLSSTARPGARSRSATKRKPSASPLKARRTTTARPRGKSDGRAGARAGASSSRQGRSRARVGIPSSGKLVFDGIEIPPLDKAVSSAMKKKDAMTLGDEDADGEVDEDHASHADAQKGELGGEKEPAEGEETEVVDEAGGGEGEKGEKAEQKAEQEEEEGEGEGEGEGEENEPGPEPEPEPEPEQGEQEEQELELEQVEQEEDEQMVVDRPEQPEEETEDEIGGAIQDDTSSLGNSNKENEAPELPQDQEGNDHGEDIDDHQAMDTIGAADIYGGASDSEINDDDLAAMAAAASLFGAAVATTTMATSTVKTAAGTVTVGFIGSGEPGAASGNGTMGDLDSMDGIDAMDGMDGMDGMDDLVGVTDQDLDDMGDIGGPIDEDIHSYLA